MKRSSKKLLLLSYVLLAVVGTANAQQTFKSTPKSVIPYLEYLPSDYNSNSAKYPIVIFLHGIGERGPATNDLTILESAISSVTKHGPPRYVKEGTNFPFVLISPQLKENFGTWPSWYVREVIDYCKTYLRIDERRIYVTGLSLGGGGTWVAAQDFPELFAAIAPVCGGYNSPSLACGIAGENLPVWAFHGDKDTVVPLSRTTTMVNAINACTPAPSPAALLTIYKGVAHNAWDYSYRTDNSLHTPNVYEWLLSYTNTVNKGNYIPVANAGTDKSTSAKSLVLYGSATDKEGAIASYAWKKLSGPDATMINATTKTLSLSDLQIGTYYFSLTAHDAAGNTDTDYVKVVIKNALPVANAGADKEVVSPATSIVLKGSATDSDGVITSYQWSKVSGPTAMLKNTASTEMTATNLVAGTYTFRLKAVDNLGGSDIDDVMVTVSAASPPVVSAGLDKLVKLPTTSATLTGTCSDSDGEITGMLWSKVSGPACNMYNTNTASLKLTGLVSGDYIFRLTASDNDGQTSYDDVTLTVDAPPVVNAGADKMIYLPLMTPLIFSGTATDSDGVVVKYQWSKYSGPNVTVSNTTTSQMTVSKMYEGTYVFKFQATDDLGASAYDYVTVTVIDPAISDTAAGDAVIVSGELMENDPGDADLEGASMRIYTATGKEVYSGTWSAELPWDAMRDKGLYIVTVMKDGKRIRVPKVYKKDF